MLNKAAKKWVKALKSGKYEQTVGQLKRDGKYCCLGVACELAKKDGVINHYAGSAEILPAVVQKRLGLNTRIGHFNRYYSDCKSLATLNDNYTSFEEIAKIIESEPKGLFRNRKKS